MDEIVDRVLYLLNASSCRKLTVAEQEFFDENYCRLLCTKEEEAPNDDSAEDPSDYDADFSDVDDSNQDSNTALLDIRVEQAGVDMEEEAEVEKQEQLENLSEEAKEKEPVATKRGMRYTARNVNFNNIWWSIPDEFERERAIRGRSERMNYVPRCSKTFSGKADVFKSLVTPDLVGYIVLETNRKAKIIYDKNNLSSQPMQMRRWYDTTEEEIYAYIAILLYAGAEKANEIDVKDLFHQSNMAFYRAVMSLERFEQISRFIRFDDGSTRKVSLQTDKLAAFRCVWNLFQNNLVNAYQPSKELRIDEQLVAFCDGRCAFKMFMPNKPDKYGIQIFWIVDAKTSFPLKGEIYVGKQLCDNGSESISHQLVIRLAEKYLDNGYNITSDKFFTSVPLALELSSRNTTTIGPIKSIKPELPKFFTLADKDFKLTRDKFSTIFCYSQSMQLCSYATETKRNVLMLSTAHHDKEIDEASKKPSVILDYHSNKGGLDTLDRMATVYTCKRKTNRWPVTLFYNLLDCAGVAAYRMSAICSGKKISENRKCFLKELALELADMHIQNRIAKPTLQTHVKTAMKLIGYEIETPTHILEVRKNNIKQRCETCKIEKKDNRTTAVCDLCYRAACTKHYVRVCRKCYEEDNNVPIGDILLPYNSAEPPEKRPKQSDTT